MGLWPYRFAMAANPIDANKTDYLRYSSRACPHCNQPLERIRRRWYDRVLSLFSPRQRYHCRNFSCRWEGTLSVTQREARETSIQ